MYLWIACNIKCKGKFVLVPKHHAVKLYEEAEVKVSAVLIWH